MVHFIGAGPGAPDLITVRGRKMLEEADVILYAGSLVNPALLGFARADCRIFNTAKMSLDQVIAVMEEYRDREVVRLHTGDPSLYGAVREQMEQLDVLKIPYDMVPGISAYQAAVASLKKELTIPGVTQSVILTRQGGRTAVPGRQTVKDFAAHGSTMILYLSASLTEGARRELLAGGYPKDTPVAVVYKASWPEEKILHTSVGNFPEDMDRAGISRLAVIMIGEAFATESGGREVEKSRLYSSHYSTGYREARESLIWMCACTEKGAELMKNLAGKWREEDCDLSATNDYLSKKKMTFEQHVKCSSHPENEKESLRELVEKSFSRADVMIFFSSAGIAVRSIAPFLKGKAADPAVLAVDELGCFCIPILSGHIGGANRYAETVSRLIGAQPVVTTATDLEHKFAVDVFAKDNGLKIPDLHKMKEISARIVGGEVIRVRVDTDISGTVPEELRIVDAIEDSAKPGYVGGCQKHERKAEADLVISDCLGADLVIPDLYVGIGCRKNVPRETLSRAFHTLCETEHICPEAIAGFASIDLKKNEQGLLDFAKAMNIRPVFYSSEELKAVPGDYHDSEFVEKVTGVGNVCERAAMKAAGADAALVVRKSALDGVTLAVARRPLVIEFQRGNIGTAL